MLPENTTIVDGLAEYKKRICYWLPKAYKQEVSGGKWYEKTSDRLCSHTILPNSSHPYLRTHWTGRPRWTSIRSIVGFRESRIVGHGTFKNNRTTVLSVYK